MGHSARSSQGAQARDQGLGQALGHPQPPVGPVAKLARAHAASSAPALTQAAPGCSVGLSCPTAEGGPRAPHVPWRAQGLLGVPVTGLLVA